jgi:hypothetical protein
MLDSHHFLVWSCWSFGFSHAHKDSISICMLKIWISMGSILKKNQNRVAQILIIFCLSFINYLKCSLGYIWLNWLLNYPAFKSPWAKKVEFWIIDNSSLLWTLYHWWAGAATLVRASWVWLMVMDLNRYHSKCFHKCNLSMQNHLIQSFGKHLILHFSCNDWQNNHEIRKKKPQVRYSKLHPWWSQNWEHNWSLDSRWYEGQNQPLKPP